MSFLPKSAKNVTRVAVDAKDWVIRNPKSTIGVVIAPAAAVAATPLALVAVGFGAGGIKAGSLAAGLQAGIGNVAAGGIFAGLTSAGAGGAALAVVQGVAGSTAAAVAGGTAYIFSKSKIQDEHLQDKAKEGQIAGHKAEGKL